MTLTCEPCWCKAQHILGPFGADSDLRRWGLKLADRGGRNGKKRAIRWKRGVLSSQQSGLYICRRNSNHDYLFSVASLTIRAAF